MGLGPGTALMTDGAGELHAEPGAANGDREARRRERQARRRRARPLLIAGYALAVPGTIGVRVIVRRRLLPAFIALEVGTVLIIAGWWIWPRPPGVVINTGALIGFAAYWMREGRRRSGPLGRIRRRLGR